jgi:hypothetical protein
MDLHRFRSTFLDRFGKVEAWIVERLRDADEEGAIPKLVGQRIEALRKAIRQREAIVRKAAKVESLLTDLAALLELRATLAHAVVERAEDREGRPVYIFQEAGPNLRQPWRCRTVLKELELVCALDQLAKLLNGLSQQTPVKPSSQPRPKPAAAAAP